MQLVRLQTIDELLSAAADYNRLWRASEVALPAARAESLAVWLEKLAPGAKLELLVVVDAGRFVAALPLIGRRLKGLLPAVCLPVSPWWSSGELLLDVSADRSAADAAAALDVLIAGFARLRRPLAWLDAVRFATPRWQAFLVAAERAGLPAGIRPQTVVGQIEIDHDWDGYQARWSKSHRRKLRRCLRLAAAAGGAALRIEQSPTESDLPRLVRQGFEIEDRSWKGAAASSVLSRPGMLEFYTEQARRLAAAGYLELAFLELGGEPIAFEYGLAAQGVYYSYKVGYDQRFAELSPGQLLRYKLLERFHADPGRTLVDFAGPLSSATAKWSTRVEPVGRLTIGASTLTGRLTSAAYRTWRRCRQALFSERPAAVLSPGVRPRPAEFADLVPSGGS